MPDRNQAVVADALNNAGAGDTAMVFALLRKGGSPVDVMERHRLLSRRYYQEKDLPRMIATMLAGIQYGLTQAELCAEADPETANEVRGRVKAMSYNLGANCWPGWDEPGIVPNSTDIAIGRDAARLNMRLAVELDRPAAGMANAHWLLGAYHLADGRCHEARECFAAAAEKFRDAADRDSELMAGGYVALAGRVEHPQSGEAQAALTAAIEQLAASGTGNAKFFVAQIRTAERVFVPQAEGK